MAVANVDELPYLLAFGAIVMLLINPVYSWVASKSNLKKMVIYCYTFLIMNLLLFLFAWQILNLGESIWVGRIFYVWCNVYSFFVVSIFWVVIINLYRDARKRSFYGIIMAGGSLGALFGSEISKRFSSTFNDSGLILFSISAAFFLFLAMLLSAVLITISKKNNSTNISNTGGGSFDAIKNSLNTKEIRNIAMYVWIWTCLMTIQWITAINIVEDWSQDPEQRLKFFATIEQVISPLTLIVQLFFTNIIIKRLGIKNILLMYGVLFFAAYLMYAFFPSILAVGLVTIILRVFEYGLNKPTRESIFSTFKKNDRYKSSVFIDTFISRFGDLSGSAFTALGKLTSISANVFPLVAIPIAYYLTILGIRISKNKKITEL